MNEAYRNALEQAKADLRGKIEEIKSSPLMSEILELHQALNTLESLLRESKTSLGELFNLTSEEKSSAVKVRFDEFVGLTALEAAKRYLKKCPDARPFPEILEAISGGGGKVGDVEELRTSLTRSTLDIIKIGDRFGDIDKYPHIKRGGKKKKGVIQTLIDGDTEEIEDTNDLM